MFNNQFILSLPDEWKETTVYTFEGPQGIGVKQNLVLMIDRSVDKNTMLDAYVHGRTDSLRQTLPEFELLSETPSAIAGNAAIVVTYKYLPANSMPLYQKQYYIQKGTVVYLFTSTFNKKSLQTTAPEIDKIVSETTILDEKDVEKFITNNLFY